MEIIDECIAHFLKYTNKTYYIPEYGQFISVKRINCDNTVTISDFCRFLDDSHTTIMRQLIPITKLDDWILLTENNIKEYVKLDNYMIGLIGIHNK